MSSIKIPKHAARLQRSELAVPATSPRFFEKAAAGPADAVFLDLEDAVADSHKLQARKAAIEAINDVDWRGKLVGVRVNGLDTRWGYRDIVELAENCPRLDYVLLPKAGGARDIEFVDTLLDGIEAMHPRATPIAIEALIETALGMVQIDAIARASTRLEALVFGVGDYIVSMQAPDQLMGGFNPAYAVLTGPDARGARQAFYNDQWHYALARVASTCRAYGLRPIDGPYTDFRDADGYRASAQRALGLGCEGKWAIHPDQLALANEVFTPAPALVAWAERVSQAMAAAAQAGSGAIALDGELIDMAHLKLTENVLRRSALVAAGASRQQR